MFEFLYSSMFGNPNVAGDDNILLKKKNPKKIQINANIVKNSDKLPTPIFISEIIRERKCATTITKKIAKALSFLDVQYANVFTNAHAFIDVEIPNQILEV